MKAIILALALLSLSALAVDEVKAPVTAQEPAKVETTAEVAKTEKIAEVKLQKKAAKEACLTEKPELKNDKKALMECIKTKMEEKK